MRAAKVQASLHIRAVSPEPSLLAYTSSESRGTFRQKARSQAPLNGWACAVKICHDGMLEDTNSLDGAHMMRCNLWSIDNIQPINHTVKPAPVAQPLWLLVLGSNLLSYYQQYVAFTGKSWDWLIRCQDNVSVGNMSHVMRTCLCHVQTTKAQIIRCICAV